jgi:N-acyl-D-aspartate/D-glutamate deacylase
MQIYRDPVFRAQYREELQNSAAVFSGDWKLVHVKEVRKTELKSTEGKSIAQLASEQGKDGLDVFLDLAIEDELNTEFLLEAFNINEERVGELLTDPRVLIGLSDGGAHVEMLCEAGYCTYLLGHWVREKQVMTLERAIQRLTSEPADLFGIEKRGRLLSGSFADIVIFDEQLIGSSSPEMHYDLPGGARRLVTESVGVSHTIVNGEVLFSEQAHTGALPGRVLRPGV